MKTWEDYRKEFYRKQKERKQGIPMAPMTACMGCGHSKYHHDRLNDRKNDLNEKISPCYECQCQKYEDPMEEYNDRVEESR